MGIFNWLVKLVKKEKTEEDKLIVDLKQAVKFSILASDVISNLQPLYDSLPDAKLDILRENKIFIEHLNNVVSWLNEAKKRIRLIQTFLEHERQEKTTSYRKNFRLEENKEELLSFLLILENSIGKKIKILNQISGKIKANLSDIGSLPEKIIKKMIIELKNSTKQLKKIKKK